MKANKIIKVGKNSLKELQSEQSVYYKLRRKRSHSAYSNQNIGTNKRLRKQKFLLQIAILGFIAWGIILFINHLIDEHNKRAYKDLPKVSEFIALSDLQVIKQGTTILHPLEKNTRGNAQELRLRLQKLRMHNVLRASNSAQKLSTDDSAKAEYKIKAPSASDTVASNLQRELVQKWEEEFLAL